MSLNIALVGIAPLVLQMIAQMNPGSGPQRVSDLLLRITPRKLEVVGSIPGRYRPKSSKVVVVVFPPWRPGLWE